MVVISKFKKVSTLFKNFYKNHLLLSNTLTTIGILGSGDLISQYIEKKLSQNSSGIISLDIGKRFVESVFTFNDTKKTLSPLSQEINKSISDKNEIEKICILSGYDWSRTGNT